jgi:hypothetical protein
MSTRQGIRPQRPLIDPERFERAGRTVRLWLDEVRRRIEDEPDTSIAWEDGEPRDPSGERLAR